MKDDHCIWSNIFFTRFEISICHRSARDVIDIEPQHTRAFYPIWLRLHILGTTPIGRRVAPVLREWIALGQSRVESPSNAKIVWRFVYQTITPIGQQTYAMTIHYSGRCLRIIRPTRMLCPFERRANCTARPLLLCPCQAGRPTLLLFFENMICFEWEPFIDERWLFRPTLLDTLTLFHTQCQACL